MLGPSECLDQQGRCELQELPAQARAHRAALISSQRTQPPPTARLWIAVAAALQTVMAATSGFAEVLVLEAPWSLQNFSHQMAVSDMQHMFSQKGHERAGLPHGTPVSPCCHILWSVIFMRNLNYFIILICVPFMLLTFRNQKDIL